MDLSALKWPVIVIVIVGLGWLMTGPGTTWRYNKYTAATVGQDKDQDKKDEAGLTKLGGYLMKTFQYDKAGQCFEAAIQRYPYGDNSYYNYYRLVKIYEKQEKWQKAVDFLGLLQGWNSSQEDSRVPINNNLKLRMEKLIEVHELRR